MHLRILAVALLLACSATAAPAAAQGAGQMTISVLDLPADPAPLRAGQGQTYSASINVLITNYICALGGTFDVAVALSNAAQAPPGVAATLNPEVITFSISSGTYGSTGGTAPGDDPYNETELVSVAVTTEPTVPSGQVPLTVTASWGGGQPTGSDPGGVGCGSDISAASGTADLVLDIQGTGGAGPGGPGTGGPGGNGTGGNGTGGNGTEPPPPADGGNGLPGFEPLLLLVAAAAVAVASRRRQAD